MAITSTDKKTRAPIVEVPVASKTASLPADESELVSAVLSLVSRQAHAPASARKHSRLARRAACAPPRSQRAS